MISKNLQSYDAILQMLQKNLLSTLENNCSKTEVTNVQVLLCNWLISPSVLLAMWRWGPHLLLTVEMFGLRSLNYSYQPTKFAPLALSSGPDIYLQVGCDTT